MHISPISNFPNKISFKNTAKNGVVNMMTTKTPLMIDQHIHGAYGVNFNTAKIEEIKAVTDKLLRNGIGAFFPTLVTDTIEHIKTQISIIKQAAKTCPQILGIHLEGIFINPSKKGIHNPKQFLPLTVDNYKMIEDDFIKIVTLAPELDEGLIDYLKHKDIKIQAGHCIGGNLDEVDGVTHIFNAMSCINHRSDSTALTGLIDDRLYTEVIADGVHINDGALKLLFKSKPQDKIILISDAIPITNSDMETSVFAGKKIYYDGQKATSESGVIAGSTTLLDGIVRTLHSKRLFNPEYIENPYKYHNIEPKGEIEWDGDWNISKITYEGKQIL